jgi:hypothetical protein
MLKFVVFEINRRQILHDQKLNFAGTFLNFHYSQNMCLDESYPTVIKIFIFHENNHPLLPDENFELSYLRNGWTDFDES